MQLWKRKRHTIDGMTGMMLAWIITQSVFPFFFNKKKKSW